MPLILHSYSCSCGFKSDNYSSWYCPKCNKNNREEYLFEPWQNDLRRAGYKGDFELSELIEACGENLRLIAKHGEFPRFTILNQPWVAFGYSNECGGSTPTEAVARLLLALKERSMLP